MNWTMALRLPARADRELQKEGWPMTHPPAWVMIEIPSAIWQTRQLAQRVDFLSVGINDLAQYLLTVDRDNTQVAGLYNDLHPNGAEDRVAHIIKTVTAAVTW